MRLPSIACILTFVSIAAGAGSDWPTHGGDYRALRYSGLAQVDRGNVKKLAPAWVFQTGDYENGLQATPIVVDGVVYISTSNNWVFALDGATGDTLWEYRHPELKYVPGYGRQNRGVAVGHGLVFMGTAENDVVAIDAKTGREVWRVSMQDPRQCGCNITGAPLLVKDMIVAGVTGGDSAHRGYLTALDARTGRLRWRFYTIPGPGEPGHETWPGESWKYGGGATWMTGSYDAELNLLYWGTGNPAADFDATNRKGTNLYTGSVIALDPDTGKLKWHYQEIPQDVWDYDASFEIILADLPVNGHTRKVLLHPGKSGFLWVLDRTTGEFLKAWPFVEHFNWVKGITEDGTLVGRNEPERDRPKLFCPGAIGGKSWNESAFSPRTGLIYIPVVEVCSEIVAQEQEPEQGASFFGGAFTMKPPPGDRPRGYLAAFDPVTGKRRWVHPARSWLLASVLASAGDLIFCGSPEGEFFALDAATGERLWTFQTGGGHRGSAVAYSIKGRQYVATPTGWGSIVGKFHPALFPNTPAPRPGSALFVFALPQEEAR
jgi:alcohol dehydrogenase (cytochrome c)